ncbi:hypothetical protein Dip518_000908 [Parelusimicrobium proximum]|uniref:hypothetical protein n=1 Tax=Parelusimicrobium proximum TaxID=3228953 RepID=UPI003D182C5D
MRKIFLLVSLVFIAVSGRAGTDPFFMLKTGDFLLDSEVSAYYNYNGWDDVKYYQLKETLKYGFIDRWEIGVSAGVARVNDDGEKDNGLIDPEFYVKWRVADGIDNRDILIDVSAYISPSLFDSYLDDDPDGAAKGSTDFGFRGLVGKQAKGSGKGYDAFTLGGYMELNFPGSTDSTKSATDIILGGLGRYYIDGYNAIDADVRLSFKGKRTDGGDSDTGVRFTAGYSRKFLENLDLNPYGYIESHDAGGYKTEFAMGAKLRYVF